METRLLNAVEEPRMMRESRTEVLDVKTIEATGMVVRELTWENR